MFSDVRLKSMKILLSALLIFAFTACAGLERKPAEGGAASEVEMTRAELDQTYLEAQLYIFAGNLSKSREVLEASLLRRPPADSTVEFERMLARVEASSGQTEEAFERLTILNKRFPESIPVLSDFAQFLYGIQFKEQAFAAYSKLTQLVPEHSNHWIYRGLLALELSKVQEAWDSFDHLIHKSSDAKHLGHLYMGKLLQMTDFSKKAEHQFRLCLKVEEEAKDCALELASHMRKLGRSKEAFVFLEKYVTNHKPKSSIPVLKKLLDWSLSEGNELKVSHYVELLERLRPSDINLKRRAALIFMERKDLESAKERLAIVMKDEESNVQDISNYLHLLSLMGQRQEQIDFLEKVVQTKRINEMIFFKKFNLDKLQFGKNKAEKKLKNTCKTQEINISACSYVYSYILFEDGRLKQARRSLEKQVKANEETDDLKLKYFLSQVYLKEGARTKAMDMLDQILAENRTYAPALNFKAYTLLQSNESLKEAEELSLRALAVQPQNGHYLDTYGWILYKKGLFKESVAVLGQAFQIKPEEPEISEHLADALAAIGDNTRAEEFYKLASKLFTGENTSRVDRKLANIQKTQRSIGSVPD